MAGSLDRGDKHPLVFGASTCDPLWDDATLFRDESLEFLLGFVVDKIFLVVAKPAGTFLSHLTGRATLRGASALTGSA